MRKAIRPRATDNAKIIRVIMTDSLVGYGTEDDPCRGVMRYWDFDGKLLAEYDPILDCGIHDRYKQPMDD